MKAIKNKYILEKVSEEYEKQGIILLTDYKKKKDNIARIVSAPENGFYKKGDIVICNKLMFESFGDLIIIDEYGIIAKYNDSFKRNIVDITINQNYVLVKITAKTDEIKIGDQKMFLDTSWQEYIHAPTFGEVIQIPTKLFFSENPKHYNKSLPFDTEMEVKKGDKVHFHYLSRKNCTLNGLYFKENGEEFLLIEYSSLFVLERDADIQMLNGYMAIEILEDKKDGESTSFGLIQVDLRDKEKRKKWGRGVIKYKGTPNKNYTQWYGFDERNADIQIGDEVVFVITKMSKFGQDMHINNDKLKGLFRLQTKDIIYKVEKSCTQ